MADRIIRRLLKVLNRYFMIPLFRLGLGAFIGNPITGYIMVMKTIGWRTGKIRYVPVNYALFDGNVYCMAGFGKATHWYRNLKAHPKIELILPGGSIAGLVDDGLVTTDSIRVVRQLFRNSGILGRLAGVNPSTISDNELQEKTKDYPLICIRPLGVGSGAGDMGGWLWILSFVFTIIVIWFIFL